MDGALRSLQQRMASGNQSRYPWRWSLERLLRGLSTERACSADAFTECWLIEQIALWNQALRPARLVLTEFEPGKLCLRSYDDRDGFGAMYRGGSGNENDGAFLMAWLPRQHFCIREVRVHDRMHVERLSFVASFIVGPAPNLHRVVLRPRYRLEPEGGFLEAFGPPQCLRDLSLSNVHITDSIAPKVAEVLRANASTLHTVTLVGNQLSPEAACTLLLALVACEQLRVLSLQDSTDSSACDAMAELFRSNRALQKLTLVGLGKAGMTCKHFDSSERRRVCAHCLKDMFAALGSVLCFQNLTLVSTPIKALMGATLARFLKRHHSIVTLSLEGCTVDSEGAVQIAKALSTNCTLEHLRLPDCTLEGDVVTKLCSAIATNKNLKNLVLPEFFTSSRTIDEGGPTLDLLKRVCAGRVYFPLSVPLPSFVSPALAEGLSCASKLKICHWGIVSDVVFAMYASMSLNSSLQCLHVDYMGGADTGAESESLLNALCVALTACGRFHTFHLDLHRSFNDFEEAIPLAEIFNALATNPRLRKLSLTVPRLDQKAAQLLSLFVPQCKRSLVELRIKSCDAIPEAAFSVVFAMVTKNTFLSKLTLRCTAWDDVVRANAVLDDALEHNVGLLNKAARFVMSMGSAGGPGALANERSCAAAFDELWNTAALSEHLVMLSGKLEHEVLQAITKARCYLQENYMVYAGVVQVSVVCEAIDGSMQLDALNADCWRAVVQYLKLSDVKASVH
uniref:Protein nlrc3 n=1 Tax=Rhipicephalus zambeziensis TaxID=60191 RepID=A0A224Z5Z1_9ACAR